MTVQLGEQCLLFSLRNARGNIPTPPHTYCHAPFRFAGGRCLATRVCADVRRATILLRGLTPAAAAVYLVGGKTPRFCSSVP